MASEEIIPFWGYPDANMNWCEEDYVVTKYIAEFWNTISSFFIIVMGLHGVLVYWNNEQKYWDRRHSVIFSLIMVVGIGSTIFHATLRQAGQILDELPMVWGNHALIYSTLRLREQGQSSWILCALLLSCFIHTVVYAYFHWHNLFLMMYGLGFAFQMFLFWRQMVEGLERGIYPLTWFCIYMFVGFHFGALILWVIEMLFCESVRRFQLHAFWHLGAGLGQYYWNLVLVINRLHFKSRKPKLRRTPLFQIPHIVVYR